MDFTKKAYQLVWALGSWASHQKFKRNKIHAALLCRHFPDSSTICDWSVLGITQWRMQRQLKRKRSPTSFCSLAPLVFPHHRSSEFSFPLGYICVTKPILFVCIWFYYLMHLFVDLKVSVVFDELYDRVPHPDMNLERSISEVSFYFFNFICLT